MNEEDLTIFSIDDFLKNEQDNGNGKNKISNGFRPVYSISPREHLIRLEERSNLKEYLIILRDFLANKMPITHFGLMRKLIGKQWDHNLRLSLRFKDFEKEEFEDYLSENAQAIKERIGILIEYCGDATQTNLMPAIQEFISVPFNMATDEKIVDIYEKVRNEQLPYYPDNFFHPENKRVPKILTRHLVDRVLEISHDGLAERLTPDDFNNNNLSFMLYQYFSGDVKKALKHSYNAKEIPALYTHEYGTDDVLKEVFMRLDLSGRKK